MENNTPVTPTIEVPIVQLNELLRQNEALKAENDKFRAAAPVLKGIAVLSIDIYKTFRLAELVDKITPIFNKKITLMSLTTLTKNLYYHFTDDSLDDGEGLGKVMSELIDRNRDALEAVSDITDNIDAIIEQTGLESDTLEQMQNIKRSFFELQPTAPLKPKKIWI